MIAWIHTLPIISREIIPIGLSASRWLPYSTDSYFHPLVLEFVSISWQISKLQIWKNTAGKSATLPVDGRWAWPFSQIQVWHFHCCQMNMEKTCPSKRRFGQFSPALVSRRKTRKAEGLHRFVTVIWAILSFCQRYLDITQDGVNIVTHRQFNGYRTILCSWFHPS